MSSWPGDFWLLSFYKIAIKPNIHCLRPSRQHRDNANQTCTAQISQLQLELKLRKKHCTNTAEVRKQPEHVYFDYKYENLDGSGILALEGEPINAKIYTETPVLWKNAILNHHMSLYQQDKQSQMPRFRPSENGDQLLGKGNYSDDTK